MRPANEPKVYFDILHLVKACQLLPPFALGKYRNTETQRQIQIFKERDFCTKNDLILKSDSRRRVSGVFADKAAISAAKASSCFFHKAKCMRMKN